MKPFKEVSQENKKQVVTIPEDLQLSHDERKVLSRGLSFIPVNQNFNKSNTQEDLQRFFRRVKLHAHFNDLDKPITNIDDNEDSLLNKRNPRTLVRVPVWMHVFHISSIVLVPWFSCLGGYLAVPNDYPLVLGCDEHVSSSCLRSLVVRALER